MSDTNNEDLKLNKIIQEAINMSIISELLELKLITEKQYYKLKEKIEKF